MGSQPAYWADPYQQNPFSKLWQPKMSCISLVSKAPIIRYTSSVGIYSLICSEKEARVEFFWNTHRIVVTLASPCLDLSLSWKEEK